MQANIHIVDVPGKQRGKGMKNLCNNNNKIAKKSPNLGKDTFKSNNLRKFQLESTKGILSCIIQPVKNL